MNTIMVRIFLFAYFISFLPFGLLAQNYVSECLAKFSEMPSSLNHNGFMDLIKKGNYLTAKTVALLDEEPSSTIRRIPIGKYQVGRYAHCFFIRVNLHYKTGEFLSYDMCSKTINTKTGEINDSDFYLISFSTDLRYHNSGEFELLDDKLVRITTKTVDSEEKKTTVERTIYKFGRNRLEFERHL